MRRNWRASVSGSFRRNLVGLRFGRLVVVSFAPSPDEKSQWNALCDCGTHANVELFASMLDAYAQARVDAERAELETLYKSERDHLRSMLGSADADEVHTINGEIAGLSGASRITRARITK